tara:strand:- start:3395 stop:3946 length:552 start_codon:yes stop_codon:yes gene_type:complete
MPCTIADGREWVCKEQVGGIVAVYFANDILLNTPTVITAAATGTIAAATLADIDGVGTTATLYKYALPEYTASYTETLTSAPENGTLFYEQAVELTLHKLTANDRDEIKLLAAGRPNVILEDNNGNFILAGWRKGMNVTTAAAQTGTAAGDLSGYVISMTGSEPVAAPFIVDLSSATIVSAPV